MGFPYSSGDVLTAADLNQSSGLVLVKTQTIGTAVSSVTVTDAFSATFDNYRIVVTNNFGSVSSGLCLRFGSTSSGYYGNMSYVLYSASAYSFVPLTNTNKLFLGLSSATGTPGVTSSFDCHSPYLSTNTTIHGTWFGRQYTGQFGGQDTTTNSYTSFQIFNETGTLTGGTIRVYGYNNG